MTSEEWYWDRRNPLDYVSEHTVDARWYLKKHADDKSYGVLRIVSHPDLKPGHLRSTLISIKSIRIKNEIETMQTIKDYLVSICELDTYKIDNEVEMETKEYVAPKKELEELYGVKIFG